MAVLLPVFAAATFAPVADRRASADFFVWRIAGLSDPSAEGTGFYFIAEKRLSKEADDMMGWEPATWPVLAGGVGPVATLSEIDGFKTALTA